MQIPLQNYLSSILESLESHAILDGLGLSDIARRGHSRAVRNAATPLQGLQSVENDLERPYHVLRAHFEADARSEGYDYGFVAEQITTVLEKAVSCTESKMTIVAVASTHLDDLEFLTELRDRLTLRLHSSDLPRQR